ncbi:unnamed protein product [Ilex paraguariensis]|uniref:Uncharacterized protein n=1 Tax=Ilex paraguariensis TaxID=185542 RepID=A0ABC8V5P1_9AQUA
MTDGVNIVIDENSFPETDELKHVEIRDVVHLIVKNKAFTNLSSKKVQLEIRDISTVQIHEQAFQQIQGNLSVLIENCSNVRMNVHAISSIQDLTITDVAQLQMEEPEQNPRANTFSTPKTPSKPCKPRTLKIKVSNSNIDQFPENFFPSSIREITITDCNVGSFRKNSIIAPNGENITIKETNIQVIESEAFTPKCGRYFKGQILLKDLNIGEIQSNAMYFSGNNFSLIDTK